MKYTDKKQINLGKKSDKKLFYQCIKLKKQLRI